MRAGRHDPPLVEHDDAVGAGAGWGGRRHRYFRSHRQGTEPIFAAKELAMLMIEVEREEDGRWIAEIARYPGCSPTARPKRMRAHAPPLWHVERSPI